MSKSKSQIGHSAIYNKSLKDFIGKKVIVTVDRPLGSKHPEWDWSYPVNYGYVDQIISGDGEFLDAYILGVDRPVVYIEGHCIAIIRRLRESDDKLIVVPEGMDFTNDEIQKQVFFQEQFFDSVILR